MSESRPTGIAVIAPPWYTPENIASARRAGVEVIRANPSDVYITSAAQRVFTHADAVALRKVYQANEVTREMQAELFATLQKVEALLPHCPHHRIEHLHLDNPASVSRCLDCGAEGV